MGEHINGSPFKINVLEREIGDASKVKVKGNSLKEGKTHMENEFTIGSRRLLNHFESIFKSAMLYSEF